MLSAIGQTCVCIEKVSGICAQPHYAHGARFEIHRRGQRAVPRGVGENRKRSGQGYLRALSSRSVTILWFIFNIGHQGQCATKYVIACLMYLANAWHGSSELQELMMSGLLQKIIAIGIHTHFRSRSMCDPNCIYIDSRKYWASAHTNSSDYSSIRCYFRITTTVTSEL